MLTTALLIAIGVLAVIIFFQERKQRKTEYEIDVLKIINDGLLERLQTSKKPYNKLEQQLLRRNQAIHRWSNN